MESLYKNIDVSYLEDYENYVDDASPVALGSKKFLDFEDPKLLEMFDISPRRGFLPDQDPGEWVLPPQYDKYEELGENLSYYISENKVREAILSLPIIDSDSDLMSVPELRRAHLLLTVLMHAYVQGSRMDSDQIEQYVPEIIAKPLVVVSKKLGHVPIVTHADLDLWNWKRKNPDIEDLSVDNLELLLGWLNTESEHWFFLTTTNIEWVGARAVVPMVDCIKFVQRQHKEQIDIYTCANHLTPLLHSIKDVILSLIPILERMRERCIPDQFYKYQRPYVSGWVGNSKIPNGMLYIGCYGNKRKRYHGASAGQSSLIRMLDIFFGIKHKYDFIKEMEKYMPQDHRRFLFLLSKITPSLRDFIEENKELIPETENAFFEGIEALRQFRDEHIKLACEYIVVQANKQIHAHANYKESIETMQENFAQYVRQDRVYGTGGTQLMPFLKTTRNETK
jgi:indoleamine 2,3-dioxygenase